MSTAPVRKRKPRSLAAGDRGSASPGQKKKTAKKTAKKSTPRTSSVATAHSYLKRLRAIKGVTKSDFAMFSDEIVSSSISEFISTGSLALDRFIGGGFPLDRISEVASWEGVGKSTLLDMATAQVQRMGGIGALIDSEKARNAKYTEMLGVDLGKLLAVEIDTTEQGFEQIENLIAVQEQVKLLMKGRPPPMLIVWDSIGGTPTKAEVAGASDDKHVGSAARVIKQNLRRLTARLDKLRVALVMANHFYTQIGGYGGRVSYGGSGIRYFSTLRLWLTRTNEIKVGEKVVGHAIKAQLKKTRIKSPSSPIETALIYGAGFDNSYSLLEWGKKAINAAGTPWVQQTNSNYWLYPPGEDPIHFRQKFLGLGQLFIARPDIYQTMATQFLQEE